VLEEALRAAWAVGAGILAPGACVVLAADLGRGRLERTLLALAIGRILLTLVTLSATSVGLAGAMPVWGVLSTAVYARLAWRRRGTAARPSWRIDRASLAAVLVPVAASLFLVGVVSARSGVTDESGALVFFGRDASPDSLFYLAFARALAASGLPLAHPFAADFPVAGHHGVFAVTAGLHLVGGSDWLDSTFRVLPLVNVVGLALTGFALVRALGGNAWGASIGATLLVLGGDLFGLVRDLAGAVGIEARDLLTWAFFGPFLLPVNPGNAAAQTVFAACLLLARSPEGGTRSACCAGVLFAGVGLFKVPLWAPFLAALLLIALRPAPANARWLRLAAAVALAASLPAQLETLLRMVLPKESEILLGFSPCIGCLPRYFVDATFGSFDTSFARFAAFRLSDLLSPGEWLRIAGATLLFVVVGLGVRLLAVPQLVRGCRFEDGRPEGSAALHRLIAAAAAIGVALACTVGAAPHYLNGTQFAWSASFALWIPLGALAGRWLADARFVPLFVALALALVSSARWIREATSAAPALRVESEERELLERLAGVSQPDDLVLEPSAILSPERLSPVAWLAGRPVYLSSRHVAVYLPAPRSMRRVERLYHVFGRDDREPALAELAATGARFVYAPAALPLRFDPGGALEVVAQGPAGVIYRVRSPRQPESR
jgi:hypothetical protein